MSRAHIQRVSDRIAERFPAERIVLFGSHAADSADADSDVDLLVVLAFEGDPTPTYLEICAAIEDLVDFPLDLLVWRPADLQRRYTELNPIAREAIDHGVVLHDARASRVG